MLQMGEGGGGRGGEGDANKQGIRHASRLQIEASLFPCLIFSRRKRMFPIRVVLGANLDPTPRTRTLGFPIVSVPVLSKTTLLSSLTRCSAAPPLINTP